MDLIDHHLVQGNDYPAEELPQPCHMRFVDGQLHICTSVAVIQIRCNDDAQHTERFLDTPVAAGASVPVGHALVSVACRANTLANAYLDACTTTADNSDALYREDRGGDHPKDHHAEGAELGTAARTTQGVWILSL